MRSNAGRGALIWLAAIVVIVLAVAVLASSSPSSTPVAPPASTASAAPLAASPNAALASEPPVEPPSPAATSAATPRSSPSHTSGRLPGEPNQSLTPGAVNPAVTPSTIRSTICVSGWTSTVRPPSSYTTSLKRRQIAQYGYRDTRLADYEEDHLIPLELGGAPRDPANLWPEPYTVKLPDGTAVGARVKDQLENRLRELVCDGRMGLATAQHLIATDWIAAWRKYVTP